MAAPVFDRQRIILDLLRRSPTPPSRLQLMKWLFLIGAETEVRENVAYYDFLPYRFGPYSFTVDGELRRLREAGFITDEREIAPGQRRVVDAQVERLKPKARAVATTVLARYGKMKPRELIAEVYPRYPTYTSRSTLKEHTPVKPQDAAVFTAGYESESVDAFLKKLLDARIRRVIDVRKNAYSRKFGFSGGPLRRLCSKVGIDYQHIADLGIPSKLRADLTSDEKRQALFSRYKAEILPWEGEAQQRAVELLRDRPSALVCMERHHRDCHRGTLASVLAPKANLPVVHL
jgi:uncharacterized protein (DUF488 family)